MSLAKRNQDSARMLKIRQSKLYNDGYREQKCKFVGNDFKGK